ncbi:MAG: M23 family metallopeptidase [Cardiobacteriaceae bacterium]|nr:M23 family metallopeptidase [Cardiobacteriaceae bacterium]
MLKNDTIVRKMLWILLPSSLLLGLAFLYLSEISPAEYNKIPPAPSQPIAPQIPEIANLPTDEPSDSLPPPPAHQSAFIKRYQTLHCSQNCLSALLKSDINPVLLAQLTPLHSRLSHLSNIHIDLLYADYEHQGAINPINSKMLAIFLPQSAFFAREEHGKIAFYDKRGNAPEAAMDRYPLHYDRISSPFDLHRIHPITRQVRPHEGVDFAAPIGREVRSTGDGVVRFVGRQSGYGKLIIIDHAQGYETRYAHLHRYFVEEGERVKRGQIIAHVGNTGFSTGPHLHYEVRIHGVAHDPLTVRLPSQYPLAQEELNSWQFRAEQQMKALEMLKSAKP